jgi:hypothetical protein
MNHARSSHRGFALPLATLLTLLVGIVMVALIQRQSGVNATVQRQIERSSAYHVGRGLQEAVEAWVATQDAATIRAALGPEGHAFDLVVPGGERVRVSFTDAQGTLLSRVDALAEEDATWVRAAILDLRRRAGRDARALTRTLGPARVSVNAADVRTLIAALSSRVEADIAEGLAESILASRDGGMLDAEALTALIDASGVPAEAKPAVTQTITAEPALWRVIVERQPGRVVIPGESLPRWGGLIELRPRGSNPSPTELGRLGRVLQWNRLDAASSPRGGGGGMPSP